MYFVVFIVSLLVECERTVLFRSMSPDNGDGTYTNPVINADYSDPDVVAVGDDYYLTASSFNCMPGYLFYTVKTLLIGR